MLRRSWVIRIQWWVFNGFIDFITKIERRQEEENIHEIYLGDTFRANK